MPTDNTSAPVHRTSPVLLILAWLVVGIPAAWGVTQTVKRSMDLFKSSPPPAPILDTPTTEPTTPTTPPQQDVAPTSAPA